MEERSKKFNKVKNYYDKGFWKLSRIKEAVVAMWITQEEYKLITGEDYEL